MPTDDGRPTILERPTFLCLTWAHTRRIWHRGSLRVYHWHIPRYDIVNCENVKDIVK